MAFKYETLDEDRKNEIAQSFNKEETQENFYHLIPSWEAEHFSHGVLCQQLKDAGEHPKGKCEHEEAQSTLEAAIVDARKAGPAE